jgi:hypothetical protein
VAKIFMHIYLLKSKMLGRAAARPSPKGAPPLSTWFLCFATCLVFFFEINSGFQNQFYEKLQILASALSTKSILLSYWLAVETLIFFPLCPHLHLSLLPHMLINPFQFLYLWILQLATVMGFFLKQLIGTSFIILLFLFVLIPATSICF